MPDHVYGIIEVASSSMLKKLVIVLGLVTGLSACVGPYSNTGDGYKSYGRMLVTA